MQDQFIVPHTSKGCAYEHVAAVLTAALFLNMKVSVCPCLGIDVQIYVAKSIKMVSVCARTPRSRGGVRVGVPCLTDPSGLERGSLAAFQY